MIVSEGQIRMDPKKTAVISEWPDLKSKKQVQQFLGFCNFYRRFIKDFSKIARPLTALTGDTPFVWGPNQQSAFAALKDTLCSAPVLATYQDNAPLRVECDSSNFAPSAILSQLQDEKWHPLAYYSKALNETERNYEIYDKELMAIVLSLEEWRQYLLDTPTPIEIWSNHQNLAYFCEPQKLNRRQARWYSELQDYHFSLHHKPGSSMGKPDAITRRPDLDQGKEDNKDVTVLPAARFIVNAHITPSPSSSEFYDRILSASTKRDESVQKALDGHSSDFAILEDGLVTFQNALYVPMDEEL